ncbi:MAG: capsule assembly Wzi family protein [Terracidiphilus sp.]|nr:capsule assembly Wzi family protein [Terracidiphilus sp.]
MKLCGKAGIGILLRSTMALVLLLAAVALQAETGMAAAASADCEPAVESSPYFPVDHWIYPAMLRLYSLGYTDKVFVGLRPWTRSSVSHMLEQVSEQLEDEKPSASRDEAEGIYNSVVHELNGGAAAACSTGKGRVQLESTYTVMRGITGTPLRDSFHLGSTIVNDYGRPYQNGFNNYTGVSGYATSGRFAAYVRAEFQGAESGTGYSAALAQTLAGIDQTVDPVTHLAVPLRTIPLGPIAATQQGRLLEGYVSFQVLNHVISFGKQDEWMGSAYGAAMAYSNNAENIYAFHINRQEPLYIPLLSRLTGPFRYEFLVGELRGHTLIRNPYYTVGSAIQPNVITSGNPYVHVEKVSFRPTGNLEFGFQRTAVWGGRGHVPVTLHSFLKSFFSLAAPENGGKFGRDDPGARFGAFDFSYRLPFVRKWLTLYSDGEVHDDVSPIDAPRRAAWRPGLYLSHVPGVAKLDLRTEAVWTDPPITNSNGGHFMYWESILKQGYTNQGQLFGDWIGREGKGGQAWATYHLSGNEWIQAAWRGQKVAKDFIPGGTTLNNFDLQAVKRIRRDFEIKANVTVERWKAPIYPTGVPVYPASTQSVTATTIQLTWYPGRKVSF